MDCTRTLRGIVVAVAAIALSGQQAMACTGIQLTNNDGSIVSGRTLEFGTTIETSIAVVPRGEAFVGDTPLGDGLAYTAKYAAIGVIAYDNVKILDGVNEEGLAVGAFYFPDFASYTPATAENQSRGMSPADFPNYLLTQFATVDEVRQAVAGDGILVMPTVVPNWGPVAPPFHYVVYDKNGNSIAVEPMGGKLVVHDNPLGVMTNSPDFGWHMVNLRNYIALDPRNVPPVTIDGTTFSQFGQGSGMLGLPGDFTPPSRFVRAAVFSATAVPSDNAEAGIGQVFHILNNFDIPVGVAREESRGVIHTDYTMLTVARDPQALRYYYKTYDDPTIRMVDLKTFDLDAKGIKLLSTAGTQSFVDMSSDFK